MLLSWHGSAARRRHGLMLLVATAALCLVSTPNLATADIDSDDDDDDGGLRCCNSLVVSDAPDQSPFPKEDTVWHTDMVLSRLGNFFQLPGVTRQDRPIYRSAHQDLFLFYCTRCKLKTKNRKYFEAALFSDGSTTPHVSGWVIGKDYNLSLIHI